jgi:hypothetical protein
MSAPTTFMRAPSNERLKTRVLETLVRKKRTTSPPFASRSKSGSPLTRKTLPKRPIRVCVAASSPNG